MMLVWKLLSNVEFGQTHPWVVPLKTTSNNG